MDASFVFAEGPADRDGVYIRLRGPLGGVRFVFGGRRTVHEIMDCRLAQTLYRWTPMLRAEGVVEVRHLSMYRPNARVATTGRRSGHADALAIDVRYLTFEDGTRVDVLEDWGDRTRGEPPCPEGEGYEDADPRLRRITCAAVAHDLFALVITPHHDTAHQNHVHMEIRPGSSWRFIR